jgi:hypothetical protein
MAGSEGRVDEIVASYGHVVVDKCHPLPAVSFERVLAEAKARYVVCSRGRNRQTLPILDLPLPRPPPAGCEWIEAYRYWMDRN